MKRKERLSASVDADLIAAAERAVAEGRADNLSSWVNDALRLKLAHDARLAALASFIAAYEEEHGEISPEEMRRASRDARARAQVTGAAAPRASSPGRRRGRA